MKSLFIVGGLYLLAGILGAATGSDPDIHFLVMAVAFLIYLGYEILDAVLEANRISMLPIDITIVDKKDSAEIIPFKIKKEVKNDEDL